MIQMGKALLQTQQQSNKIIGFQPVSVFFQGYNYSEITIRILQESLKFFKYYCHHQWQRTDGGIDVWFGRFSRLVRCSSIWKQVITKRRERSRTCSVLDTLSDSYNTRHARVLRWLGSRRRRLRRWTRRGEASNPTCGCTWRCPDASENLIFWA